MGDLSWFLKKEQVDIFVKDLQADTTVQLEWLLFSLQGIDVKSLCKEIFNLLHIEIAGRYKLIRADKWDPTIDNKKHLKAIHLECAKKDKRKAKKELGWIYTSSSTEFPLGIRMRLIAEFKDVKGGLNNI